MLLNRNPVQLILVVCCFMDKTALRVASRHMSICWTRVAIDQQIEQSRRDKCVLIHWSSVDCLFASPFFGFCSSSVWPYFCSIRNQNSSIPIRQTAKFDKIITRWWPNFISCFVFSRLTSVLHFDLMSWWRATPSKATHLCITKRKCRSSKVRWINIADWYDTETRNRNCLNYFAISKFSSASCCSPSRPFSVYFQTINFTNTVRCVCSIGNRWKGIRCCHFGRGIVFSYQIKQSRISLLSKSMFIFH